MRVVVIGNPHGRRAALFEAAVRRRPGLTMERVNWSDLLTGRANLRDIVQQGDVVRIDSPGKDFEVEKLLLRAGGDDAVWDVRIDKLPDERGRVWWPAIWYQGFCRTLDKIEQQLAHCPPHRLTSHPRDIQIMFDKTSSQERLRTVGVPVPPFIGRVNGYEHLSSEMQYRGWQRVFVKLAYGSSASGAIALRSSSRGQIQAFTTVELDGRDRDGELRMYNTRRVQKLTSTAQIARVVDAVSHHVAHAERWIPKAGIDGRTFDLRVLVIGGQTCHTVARLSHTPMTNLHLLNARADAVRVRDRCGQSAWRAAMATCEAAMAAFPQSLYAGIDLLITPDFRRHAVLELNAFGDLLVGATWNGLDPYDAELAAMLDGGALVSGIAEVA